MIGKDRNVESKINGFLKNFPIVAILGARQTGKTTLVKQIAPNWKYIDLENPNDFDRVSRDPVFFFEQYPQALIIDEAQEFPAIFKVLRGVIDEAREIKGRFIITGSSSLELLEHISESLAGRVALIELGTFKSNEFHNTPLSAFYELFEDKLDKTKLSNLRVNLNLSQIHQVWLKGGYPEVSIKNDSLFFNQWMENYRNTYINRDIAKLFPKLNKVAYRRFLTILSKLSASIINKQEIARDIEMSEGTIREYMSIIEGTYIWRNLPSYEKNIRKSVVKMPKGYVRDTGLLHFLLNINNLEELYNHPIIGNSFESFVIEEIVKGIQAKDVYNWQAYYYRTRNNAEIDLILDGPFGVLPIEVKYGQSIKLNELRSLDQFVIEHNLPFGIVVNQANSVEWINPRLIQVPVGCL